MSTSAQILVVEDQDPVFALDRTWDGYPSSAGADVLRALYSEDDHRDGYFPAYGGRSPAHQLASRLVAVKPGDHTLCPLDQWRGYEYVWEIHANTGAVILHERESAGDWKSGPHLDGGTIYTPTEGDEGEFRSRDEAHGLADRVNADREGDAGRVLLLNIEAGEEEYSRPTYIDYAGRPTEEEAIPTISDTVATWLNPNTGYLVGRSLLAKQPRVTVNGRNEPTPYEQANREGIRAKIDWQGAQAVTEEGSVFALSDEQMTELAKAYKQAKRKQRRAA